MYQFLKFLLKLPIKFIILLITPILFINSGCYDPIESLSNLVAKSNQAIDKAVRISMNYSPNKLKDIVDKTALKSNQYMSNTEEGSKKQNY